MSYKHTIEVKENSTSLSTPVATTSGIQVVFGTAPVNLLDNPATATNKLFMCNTFDEAQKCLGYSKDTAFTICQSMDASFKLFGIAPVIFCNVLDPAIHNRTNENASYSIESGKITIETKGILLSTLSITLEGTESPMQQDIDYIATFDEEGNVIVAFISVKTGKVNVSSKSIDPTLVTATDIIGGVDASTREETGLELVRQIYPRFNIVPNTILAPGYSADANVASALATKCEKINGKFQAETFIDLDDKVATDYTKCFDAKKAAYLNDPHIIVLWPKVLMNDGRIFEYSAVYGALTAYIDYKNDSVPDICSNRELGISGAVLSNRNEVMLDEPQAGELNGYGIVTLLNQAGWRSWGNNTSAYPDNKDPKDRWINCRRFFSFWGNSFICTYMKNVDDPSNYRLIESIVDSENIRGNSYTPDKCAGIRIEYNKEENPIEQILEGKVVFKQYLAPYVPAEYIINTLEFDPSMLEATLTGGE